MGLCANGPFRGPNCGSGLASRPAFTLRGESRQQGQVNSSPSIVGDPALRLPSEQQPTYLRQDSRKVWEDLEAGRSPGAIATSRTRPWLASKWGGLGRRLSRG